MTSKACMRKYVDEARIKLEMVHTHTRLSLSTGSRFFFISSFPVC